MAKYRPFKEARRFARSLELKNEREWAAFAKSGLKPEDIPSYPRNIYTEWRGSGDWLGTGNVSNSQKHREFRPFPEARKFARSLKIAGSKDWDAFARGELKETHGLKPSDIPASPAAAYKDRGWAGMRDWLGTKQDSRRPFPEARQFARALKLSGWYDWYAYSRGKLKETHGLRPSDIPAQPAVAYKDQGWVGIRDWLGTKKDSSRRTRPAKIAAGEVEAPRKGTANTARRKMALELLDRAAALPKRKEAIAREIRRAATKALLEEDRILSRADLDHR